MRAPLTIAVGQPVCVAFDIAQNVLAHAAMVRSVRARVVLFPELSLSGYELDAPAVAADDPRLAPLADACAETDSTALVGAPVASASGARCIGVLAVDGAGPRVVYRKMWLGAEELAAGFVAGRRPAVITIDDWRLGLAVCKDTGVAEHAALTAGLGIDAYVAGVVHRHDDAAVNGDRARRIAAAHGVWVAISSFAGPTGDGYSSTAGGSGVWSPTGECVAQAGSAAGESATASIGTPVRIAPR